MKKISIVIPVKNGSKYIKESIESALNAELVSEVIVVDDFSNDGTREKLINKIEKLSYVNKVIYHNKNLM